MPDAELPTAASLAVERQMSEDPLYSFFASFKRRKVDFLRDV